MTDTPYQSPDSLSDETQKTPASPWRTLLISCGVIVVLILLLLPFRRDAGPAMRRTQCKSNLKQIGLALHNYADVYGGFPPACVVDENGRALHSWRVLILPYLDQRGLYESIDLTKPWNHPTNAAAYATAPACYRCPASDVAEGHTNYVAVAGEEYGLHPAEVRKFKDFEDGVSNTVLVLEIPAAKSIHWMAPLDPGAVELLTFNDQSDLSHTSGLQVLMIDGAVRFLSTSLHHETRVGLSTIAGGEILEEF